MKLPSGSRLTIRNYAGVAVAQHTLSAILEWLFAYQHESELDYIPAWAALLIEPCTAEDAAAQAAQFKGSFSDWPLDPGLLAPPQPNSEVWAARVPGAAYRALYGDGVPLGTMRGFWHDGSGYIAFLVPILPGADVAAISGYRYP